MASDLPRTLQGNRISAKLLAWATIALALLVFLTFSSLVNRGLDYSDEAYAYYWARYPSEYQFALRLSGFLLHPIDFLVNYSIAAFRGIGIAISVACGILVGFISIPADRFSRLERIALMLAMGITTLLGNFLWINTPSYNHITTWGLLLLVAGLVILSSEQLKIYQTTLASALVAVAGVMIGFAKAPVAIVAGAMTLVILAPSLICPLRRRGMLIFLQIGGFLSGFLIVIFLTLASPSHLIALLRNALTLREGDTLGFVSKHFSDIRGLRFDYLAALALGAVSILTSSIISRNFGQRTIFAAWINFFVAATIGAFGLYLVVWGPLSGTLDIYTFGLRLNILAVAIYALSVSFSHLNDSEPTSARLLVPSRVLLVAPWIASVGTGNNFTMQLGFFAGFSALAIIIASTISLPRLVTQLLAISMTLLTAWVLYQGSQAPYRLNTPILKQDTSISLAGLAGHPILVDRQSASFLTELHSVAAAAGLTANTPVIDLSGLGPGLNLALGTRPRIYPWIAAGYPNSPKILDAIWSRMTASDRSNAWVIGPIETSFDGATALIDLTPLEEKYDLVIELVEPRTKQKLQLWRPRRAR